MLPHDQESRSRSEHRFGVTSEGLEPRQLLDAAASNVTSALTFAIGLPIASLATGANLPLPAGLIENDQTTQEIITQELLNAPDQPLPAIGLATPAQTSQGYIESVSLPVVETTNSAYSNSLFASSSSTVTMAYNPNTYGASTTLNPMGNSTETALAAASAVRRPTPGRLDRISSIVRTHPIIPLPHYGEPVPEPSKAPEVNSRPAFEVPERLQQPANPTGRTPTPEATPRPTPPINNEQPQVPAIAPDEPRAALLDVQDDALRLVVTEIDEFRSPWLENRPEGSFAVGAFLVAWGSWHRRAFRDARSRRTVQPTEFLEAGPGRH
jgi:hypothetical protein